MLYMFLLNGPPKCGKSTLAREALRWFKRRGLDAHPEGFANPMRAFAASLLGVPYTSIAKDDPLELLSHETPRRMLINLSEDFLRVKYGREFFGCALLHRWRRVVSGPKPTILVIEDSGFRSEIGLQSSNLCLVRIMRPGYNFYNDSRSYLSNPDRVLINDGTLDDAYSKTLEMVDYAINKWGVTP